MDPDLMDTAQEARNEITLWYILTLPLRIGIWFWMKFFAILWFFVKLPFVITYRVIRKFFGIISWTVGSVLMIQMSVLKKGKDQLYGFGYTARNLTLTMVKEPLTFPGLLSQVLYEARWKLLISAVCIISAYIIVKFRVFEKMRWTTTRVYRVIAAVFDFIWRFFLRYVTNLTYAILSELLYYFAPWIPYGIRFLRAIYRAFRTTLGEFDEPIQTAWRRFRYDVLGQVIPCGGGDGSLAAARSDPAAAAQPRAPLRSPSKVSEDTNPIVTEDRLSCVVCMDKSRSVLLNPCRHFCLCGDCANQVFNGDRLCPICRKYIRNLVTDIYF